MVAPRAASSSAAARRERVLHVVVSPVSARMQVLPMAIGLAAEGWEVDIAGPAGRDADGIPRAGIRYLTIPMSRSWTTPEHLRNVWTLRRLIRGGGYRIIHLHGPIPGALGRLAALGSGARTVYHCRGTLYEAEGSSCGAVAASRVYAAIERMLAPVTDCVFTLNESDTEDLVSRARVPRERVQCLGVGGSGIDLDRWDASYFTAPRIASLRAGWGLPAGAFVVGYAGRLVREKGVIDLLEAFERLHASRGDSYLMIVGDALSSDRDQHTRDEFRARIREAGLEDRVAYTGWLESAREAIGVMSVLVLPSYREGFGQVLAEAGALGVPVVAAASRGARQAVVDGVTGFLVPKRDPEALGSALRTIADDPARARSMGRAAITRVREDLSQAAVLRTVRATYESLLQGAAA